MQSKSLIFASNASLYSASSIRQPALVAQHAMHATSRDVSARAGRAANRVKLGDSDLQVSECCLGTMTWGSQNTEAQAHEQLNYAFDEAGLNFLDTAEMYPVPPKAEYQGKTDKYIGTWLSGRKREDVILASKVSGYSEAKHLRDAADGTRVNASQIEESVNKSLARLGTDYIDLLQIHWPDRYVPLFGSAPFDVNLVRPDTIPFEEQLKGLDNVIRAGKVRHIGLSNETTFGVCEFVKASQAGSLPKPISIQNSYSLLARVLFETDLAEACAPHNYNIGLLAYSPLAGGSLTGKYQTGGPKESRFNLFPGYMERFNKSLAREAIGEYVALAEARGLTATQLALAWVRSRWFTASTIIGATTMEQLKQNIEAFDIDLDDDVIQEVNRIYRRRKDPAVREE